MSGERIDAVPKSKAIFKFYFGEKKWYTHQNVPKSKKISSRVQYNGTMYIISEDGLRYDDYMSLTPDEIEILFDFLKYSLPEWVREYLNLDALRETKSFVFNPLREVSLQIDTNLTIFWCPKCKRVYHPEQAHISTSDCVPRCPLCGKQLRLAPVWTILEPQNPKNEWKEVANPVFVCTSVIERIYGRSKQGQVSPWRLIKNDLRNGNLPPCPKCGGREWKYDQSGDGGKILTSSYLQCVRCGFSISSLFDRNYRLNFFTERITRPIVGKTYSLPDKLDESVDLLRYFAGDVPNPIFDHTYLRDFRYIPQIDVSSIVVGMFFGHGRGRRAYPPPRGQRIGVKIRTSALYLEVDAKYYQAVREFFERYAHYFETIKGGAFWKNEDHLKHVVLHSLAHALMSKIPEYSGLSIENFSYVLSPSRNELLIYEIADGGLGALEALAGVDESSGEPVIIDYLHAIKKSVIGCSCDGVCRYCLALPGCSEYNQNLDRFVLAPLFNVDTLDEMLANVKMFHVSDV